MFVHYGMNENLYSPTVQPETFVGEYDAYIGEQVYFWPGVVEVRESKLIVEYYGEKFTIRTSRNDIKQGDLIQVYGTLRPDHVIEPHSIVPSQQSGRQKMYIISLLGSVLVVLVFWRSWKFDREDWTFKSREATDA